MNKEVEELEGFKVPEEPKPEKIQTKNRFNVKVRSNSDQHVMFDRVIDR